jgi:CRISPR-associated exonuclease Cas4
MAVSWGTVQIGLVLLLLVTAVWLWSRGLQQETGLPNGDVIYTDSGTWYRNGDPLFANGLKLVGKPDYLVEQPNGMIIPVELKSSRAPQEPREGHLLQLAAYCLLVEENYGIRPDFGIIQYKDKAFAVDYDEDLEDELLEVLDEMREGLLEEELERDHNDWRKCAKCGVRTHCYQRLA